MNEEYITKLRYADDLVLLAASLGDQQLLLARVRTASEKYGLDLSISNTKFMVICYKNLDLGELLSGNEDIERVDRFVFP